jgi:hypothetical protein
VETGAKLTQSEAASFPLQTEDPPNKGEVFSAECAKLLPVCIFFIFKTVFVVLLQSREKAGDDGSNESRAEFRARKTLPQ